LFPVDCCKEEPYHDEVEKLAADNKDKVTADCDMECGPHDEHDHGGSTSSVAGLRAGSVAFLIAAMAVAAAF